MKYIKFNTKFWYDGYVSSLNPTEKLFFLYLFTNPRVDKTGIYELPDRFIESELNIDHAQLLQLKAKMEKDNKFYFYKDWVYIVNFAEHNKFSTAENIVKDYKKEFDSIPKEVKDYFIKELKLPYKIPIENTDKVRLSLDVSVMVIVIVIVNRVDRVDRVGRVEERLNEDINPDEIPL